MGRALVSILYVLPVLLAEGQTPYWAKSIGGSGADAINDLVVGGDGDIYAAGEFSQGLDQDGNILYSAGSTDALVLRMTPAGDIVWMTGAGGNATDRATAIATDDAGHIAVVGLFTGAADLFGSPFTSAGGTLDLFVALLDAATGNALWVRTAGSATGVDRPNSVTFASDGSVVVAGEFRGSTDFDGTILNSMPDPITLDPGIDAFIAKYSPVGDLLWVQQGAAPLTDRAVRVVCDVNDAVFTLGQFSDTITFDVQHDYNGYNNTFLIKLDAAGNEQWFRRFGGAYTDARDMLLTDDGDLLVCGDLQGAAWFEDSSPDLIVAGDPHACVLLRVDANGELLAHTTIGSANGVDARALELRSDTVSLFGEFNCQFTGLSSFYGGSGLFMATGDQDLFIARFSFNDLALTDAQQFGGQSVKRATSIASLSDGSLVFSGSFAQLLTLPSDTGVWGDTHTNGDAPACGTLFSINSAVDSVCGDPAYGRFAGLLSDGLRDGFIARGFVTGRAPYDMWYRADTDTCDLDVVDPLIHIWSAPFGAYLDSMVVCGGIHLSIMGLDAGFVQSSFSWFEDQGTCDSIAYTGFDISMLWNTGEQTRDIVATTTGWYWCTVSSANGCWSSTDSVYVEVNVVPATPLISDGMAVNDSALIAAYISSCSPVPIWTPEPPPGYSVLWFMNGDTIPNDTVIATESGVYIVYVISPEGCIGYNLVLVDIGGPEPMPNVTGVDVNFLYNGLPIPDDTLTVCYMACVGGELNYTFYVDGVPGTLSPLLNSNVLTGSCGEQADVEPMDTLQWGEVALATGWLYATLSMSINNLPCAFDSWNITLLDSIYVNVVMPPAPPLVVTPPYLCPGDTLLVTASCTACDSLAVWGLPVVGQSADADSTWVDQGGPLHAGAYAISNGVTCGTTELALVYALPVPDLLLVPEMICPGDSALLIAAYGTSFQWEGPDGPIPIDNDSIYVSDAGDYYLAQMSYAGCTLSNGPVTLVQYGPPQVGTLSDAVLCAGDSMLIVVNPDAPVSVQWDAPLSGTGLAQWIDQPGTYSCSVISCGDTLSFTIPVVGGNAQAELIDPGPLGTCAGDTVLLQAMPGMSFYQWLPGGEYLIDLPVSEAGGYQVVVFDEFGCSDTSAIVVVSVDGIAEPMTINGDSVCAGDDALLSAIGSGTIAWYAAVSDTIPLLIGDSLGLSDPASSAVFFVTQQEGGCVVGPSAVQLVVLPSPLDAELIAPGVLCVGDTGLILVDAPAGVVASWTTPAGTFTGSSISLAPVVLADSGLYSVSTFIGDCPGTVLSTVLDVNAPIPFDLGADTILCMGQEFLVTVPSTCTDPEWSTGSTGHTIVIDGAGVYSVLALDPGGCLVGDTIAVDIEDCGVIIPNVFTPNGDGENDVFTITGYGGSVSLVIFNRWGVTIAELAGAEVRWNGRTAANELVSEGVYYYEALIPRGTGAPLRKTGYVQVLW